MSTRATDYREAIEHLPEGATLVFRNFTWDEYERLLDDIADRPGLRVTYDEGRLEIMSPSLEHEEHKDFITALARVLSETLGIAIESRGSTTWKRRALRKGVEADTCFYVGDVARIVGKRNRDTSSLPAPDIAVEIDITNESLSKFPIYAVLGVPEIWRYDGTAAYFYELAGATYRGIAQSRFFPRLTPEMLRDALEQSKQEGQTVALAAFRKRLQT